MRPPMAADWRLPAGLLAGAVSAPVGVRGLGGGVSTLPAALLLLLFLLAAVPAAATSSVLMEPANTTRGVKPVRAAHRSVWVGAGGGVGGREEGESRGQKGSRGTSVSM